jgi:ribonuclease P protein component
MRAAGPHFSISVRQGAHGAAVVVSKKTEKTSVGRHRLKRRVLAVITPYCAQGHSLVVYARAGSSSLPFSEVAREVRGLLNKLLGEGVAR